MSKPHKFRHVANGTSSYDFAVYCEYCGLVVFHANRADDRDKQYEKAKKGCPCAPSEQQIRREPWNPRFQSIEQYLDDRKVAQNES